MNLATARWKPHAGYDQSTQSFLTLRVMKLQTPEVSCRTNAKTKARLIAVTS
jgi:hypothetical protein